MGLVEELYEKEKIFNELFGSIDFVIETKDYYNYPDKIYESYIVNVKSNVNLIREEIFTVITSVQGEIHETIERFFKTSIPPQSINNLWDITLDPIDAVEFLFSDDWNIRYPKILKGDIEKNITLIEVQDENGKLTDYDLKVRDIYLY